MLRWRRTLLCLVTSVGLYVFFVYNETRMPAKCPKKATYSHVDVSAARYTPCPWSAQRPGPPQPREERYWKKEISYLAAEFFEDLFLSYGVLTIARSGTALGAWRHHGKIPFDNDMDVYMLLPADLPRECLYQKMRDLAREKGLDTRLDTYGMLPGLVFSGYDPACMWFFDRGTRLGVDADVITETAAISPWWDGRIQIRYSGAVSPQSLFSSLCRCEYDNVTLGCWRDMQNYLTAYYTERFEVPLNFDELKQDFYGQVIEFKPRRWFLEIPPLSWVCTTMARLSVIQVFEWITSAELIHDRHPLVVFLANSKGAAHMLTPTIVIGCFFCWFCCRRFPGWWRRRKRRTLP